MSGLNEVCKTEDEIEQGTDNDEAGANERVEGENLSARLRQSH